MASPSSSDAAGRPSASGPGHAPGSAPRDTADAVREAQAAIAARLGLPAASTLLLQALTHPSYAHEHPPTPHNETLAFLGDAVLGLVVAELLTERQPEAGPGPLTVQRAEVVSMRGLAAWARELGLGAGLRLGRGEAQHGGRDKESVLATALEAVAAALYLTHGLAAVRPLVTRLMRLEGDASPAR